MKRLRMAPMPGWQRLSPLSDVLPIMYVEQLNPPRVYEVKMDRVAACMPWSGCWTAMACLVSWRERTEEVISPSRLIRSP